MEVLMIPSLNRDYEMKVTVIYDNTVFRNDLNADWGFSCLVEACNKKILFDTGAHGSLLLDNMRKLDIDPTEIHDVFISHAHWDHTGGLSDFLRMSPARVYLPLSCREPLNAPEVINVNESIILYQDIFSTGELENIEQSLVIKTEVGLAVITGCSHPGVDKILMTASRWGNVRFLIGGLHGFRDFDLVKNLELICPTHCTQFISEIKAHFPDKYVTAGAGKVIEI